jgi:hypothetical protein
MRMALLKDAERREKSESLKSFRRDMKNHVNVLKSIKAGLNDLETTVTNDTVNYGATDVTDVQAALSELATQIASI